MVLAEIFSPDILIVLAVVALLFGGSKLPQLARSLGSAKGEFERGLKDTSGVTDEPVSSVTAAQVAAAAAEQEAVEARARAEALKAQPMNRPSTDA